MCNLLTVCFVFPFFLLSLLNPSTPASPSLSLSFFHFLSQTFIYSTATISSLRPMICNHDAANAANVTAFANDDDGVQCSRLRTGHAIPASNASTRLIKLIAVLIQTHHRYRQNINDLPNFDLHSHLHTHAGTHQPSRRSID